MRPLRAVPLVFLGTYAGVMAAAAFARLAIRSRGDADSDEIALAAIYDGVELKSRAAAFRGGSILAWFGGVELDLRAATLAPEARLTVYTLFGGVAIRVPPGTRVESSLAAIGGGVDARADGVAPDAPTLTLDGLALFGGIAVGARADEAAGDSLEPEKV
jgi:hypothetical protein